MRAILVAVALAVLLLAGWFVKSTFLDREEQEFAVHYSWIVKWALTLAHDSHQAPPDAVFSSPQIAEAGQPNRWRVNGDLTWRDALGNPIHETYSLVIENICKAYADVQCWTLDRFALGDAAGDVSPSEPAVATGKLAGRIVEGGAAPESLPALDEEIAAVLSEEPAGETQSSVSVPRPPLAPGETAITLPERKPEILPTLTPESIEDTEQASEDTELAIADPSPSPAPASTTSEETTNQDIDLAAIAAEAEAAATSPSAGSSSPAPEPAPSEVAADDPSLAAAEAAELETADAAPTESEAALESSPSEEVSTAAPTVAAPEDETETVAALPPESETSLVPEPVVETASTPPTSTADAALVALIQDRLRRTGYNPGPIDGRFGQRTQAAILAYQGRQGLVPDGLPSQALFDHLEQSLASGATPAAVQPTVAILPVEPTPAPTPTPAPSPDSAPASAPETAAAPVPQPGAPVATSPQVPVVADESLVFLIQHRLREAGFPPTRFDGRMGPDTAAAIRAYQAQRGLSVDGAPTRQLLDRLEAEVLSKRTPAEPTALLPASPDPGASVACAGTGADSAACAEALRQLAPAPGAAGANAAGIARDGGIAPIPQ